MARKMIVGVVGGSRRPAVIDKGEWESHLQLAIAVGEMIAECDYTILTGATLGKGTGRINGNAMRASVAKDGLAIGILPKSGRQAAKEATVVFDRVKRVLEVRTILTSAQRNYINGVAPDVLIALPGGSGTAAEVAVALSFGRPVIYLGSLRYLNKLSADSVTKKLAEINHGDQVHIDIETVSRLKGIGTECNDVIAVRSRLQELERDVRDDFTQYPDNVEGAPDKLEFEAALAQAVLTLSRIDSIDNHSKS